MEIQLEKKRLFELQMITNRCRILPTSTSVHMQGHDCIEANQHKKRAQTKSTNDENPNNDGIGESGSKLDSFLPLIFNCQKEMVGSMRISSWLYLSLVSRCFMYACKRFNLCMQYNMLNTLHSTSWVQLLSIIFFIVVMNLNLKKTQLWLNIYCSSVQSLSHVSL